MNQKEKFSKTENEFPTGNPSFLGSAFLLKVLVS